MRKYCTKERNAVFMLSLLITLLLTLWSILFSESFVQVTSSIYTFFSVKVGWLYLLVIAIFVAFCLLLAFGPYGRIRLGPDDSQPAYSTFSWIAMLFCAGMGVGLVFWGVSEPLTHFLYPDGIQGGTDAAAAFAIQASFMHWGIHPWAIYSVLGLAIAYFTFRKNEKVLVSSTLLPLLGQRRVQGVLGKAVDILTIVITVFGISTTLGLSALQINGGLNYLFPKIEISMQTQILIIMVAAVAFIASAVSGVDRGIKILSNVNLYIALILCVLAFAVGPKLEILNNLISGVGNYLSGIVRESLSVHAYGDNSWVINWRVFYWAWWISWAPFVGCFAARISKGRTIREFVLGVLLVPTMASCLWFAIFGSLGIHTAYYGTILPEVLASMVKTPEIALFAVLGQYPMSSLLSILAIVLLFAFFITSADSGTLVLGIFSSDGNLEPSSLRKTMWGLLISLLAIGLLLTGGLSSIQIVSIVIAFPFLFILMGCCYSLAKALRQEHT